MNGSYIFYQIENNLKQKRFEFKYAEELIQFGRQHNFTCLAPIFILIYIYLLIILFRKCAALHNWITVYLQQKKIRHSLYIEIDIFICIRQRISKIAYVQAYRISYLFSCWHSNDSINFYSPVAAPVLVWLIFAVFVFQHCIGYTKNSQLHTNFCQKIIAIMSFLYC